MQLSLAYAGVMQCRDLCSFVLLYKSIEVEHYCVCVREPAAI